MAKFGDTILRACADLASRRPWAIVIVSLIITVFAAYASLGLSVNTSTDDILSADLPFRQTDIAYRAAFPKELSHLHAFRLLLSVLFTALIKPTL